MKFQLGIELRYLVNPHVIDFWEQLYEALAAKNAKADLLEDIAEIILNLRDIQLIMDGKAD